MNIVLKHFVVLAPFKNALIEFSFTAPVAVLITVL
jgi:hypothetical protein